MKYYTTDCDPTWGTPIDLWRCLSLSTIGRSKHESVCITILAAICLGNSFCIIWLNSSAVAVIYLFKRFLKLFIRNYMRQYRICSKDLAKHCLLWDIRLHVRLLKYIWFYEIYIFLDYHIMISISRINKLNRYSYLKIIFQRKKEVKYFFFL